jgi:sulfate transport system substrate-binding protein
VAIGRCGLLFLLLLCIIGCGARSDELELVNVSFDATRELYEEINQAFSNDYQQKQGKRVRVTQSHGGSGSQARAVIDGLRADVVSLALASDVEAIRKAWLIAEGWQQRLPNQSCPATSTIVLVVRQGNPKQIRDWPDLARPDVRVITPHPKTSGGARWNFLAAWGFVTCKRGGTEAEARDFVRKLYANVPKLDTGARGATDTFAKRGQGDVLLAWENEALQLTEANQELGLAIVYPSASILAEPPVAVVDRWVDERGTRSLAEAYARFMYSEEAQSLLGKHGYRPISEAAQRVYAAHFPRIRRFTLNEVAGDWQLAQQRFFADGGVFDQVYDVKRR